MLRHVSITLEMIKFQHTVFALPFALLAAFVVAGGIPAPVTLAWILVAMVGARSAAMAFNRLVDAPNRRGEPADRYARASRGTRVARLRRVLHPRLDRALRLRLLEA